MNANETVVRYGVEGYGSIELRGTEEFVLRHQTTIQPIIEDLTKKYVDEEVAKGRSADEVAAEFLDALTLASQKALDAPEEHKSVSVRVGD